MAHIANNYSKIQGPILPDLQSPRPPPPPQPPFYLCNAKFKGKRVLETISQHYNSAKTKLLKI